MLEHTYAYAIKCEVLICVQCCVFELRNDIVIG